MKTIRNEHLIRWLAPYSLGAMLIVLGGCPMIASAPPEGFFTPPSGGDPDSAVGSRVPDIGPVLDEPGRPIPGIGEPDGERPAIGDSDSDPTIGEPDGDPAIEDSDSEPETEPVSGTIDGDGDGDGGLQSGTLTAASFDDNLNLDAFREFISGFLQADGSGDLPQVTLGDRAIITVLDESGEPVGNARVVVTAGGHGQQAEQTVIDIPTRSDGRVLYSTGVDGGGDATSFTVSVHPPDGSATVTASTDLTDLEWTVTLPGAIAALPTQLDLAFVVDATGSMSDELEFLKVEMDDIVSSIAGAYPNVDQKYALIVYRDAGDVYVTRTFDFTSSLADFQADLSAQRARAGGDYPEAMHEALEEAEALSWRSGDTARVLFLIADAPPHDEYAQRTLDAVMGLRSTGVAIYPVAASGVADAAEYIMRSAALLTLSEYCFLTDDSSVGNPHAEPHIPCYDVQRLDQLLVRLTSSELAGERLYPESEDIIRVVGNPVNGVCEDEQVQDQTQ